MRPLDIVSASSAMARETCESADVVSQCGDETTTQHNVQRFLEWLEQSQRGAPLARYAKKRKDVVMLLAVQP